MFTPSKNPPRTLPGAAIYRLREIHNLSYRGLAARIQSAGANVDHAHLYRIEHGAGYTQDALSQIAKGLGVQVADLFVDPRLAALSALPDAWREEAERKVADYVSDLCAAYNNRSPPR